MPFSWNIFAVRGASQHGASHGARGPYKNATRITDAADPCVTAHRAIALLGIAPAFGATQGYMPLLCTYAYVRYPALSGGVCAVSHRTYPPGLAALAMPPHRNRFTGKGGKTRCIGVVMVCICALERGCCEVSTARASPPYPRHSYTSRDGARPITSRDGAARS